MDVSTLGDFLFSLGGAAAAACLVYGGWLSIRHAAGWDTADKRRSWHPNALAEAPPESEEANDPVKSIAVFALIMAALIQAPPGHADEFEEAMLEYERGRYVEAQARFRVLAARGDAMAQEILGMMYAFGPRLYPGVSGDLHAARQWLDRAARSGRPAARYTYCALARREPSIRTVTWKCFDRLTEAGFPSR